MKRYAALWGAGMLVLALAAATSAGAQIPEPSGSYSVSVHGSLTVCLNPAANYAEESCSASNVLVYPVTDELNGTITWASGVGCESDYGVSAALPPTASPSSVTTNAHTVAKITSYDAATGVGTASSTGYTGGSCNGADFDSSGATEISSGTIQFVLSEGGRRNDVLVTQLTDPTNSISSFSLIATDLKQTR
jgi:hypothetical protein